MNADADRNRGDASGLADSEIDTLLAEAYDGPALPRSLGKRLDRMVVQQWGQPLDMTGPQPKRRQHGSGHGPQAWKVWSAAASLAAGLLLVVVLVGSSPAYGWTQMVDALGRLASRLIPAEQPIVDVGDHSRGDRGQPAPASALRSSTPAALQADGSSRAESPRAADSLAGAEVPPGGPPASQKLAAAGADPEGPPGAPLTGAASLGWSPVPVVDLPADEVVRQVDAVLQQLWEEKGVNPVAPASDEELLRRVYLDLAGRTPTVHEIRSYLDDPSPDRYARLVDRLLESRDHATHLATIWRNILLPEGTDLSRFGGVEAFDRWLSDQFGKNRPYDDLVRELLLAEGRLTSSGPLLFYAALKLDADQLASKSARVFLGMRLECAQCHDDPFEPWTQQDFWSFAAFFARISRPNAELEAVSTVMRVRDVDHGEVTLPDSTEVVSPRLLDGSPVDMSPASESRRRQLARWITAPDNPYFAKAAVNRVWAHLFGRGIVDPVDGFGQQHAAASPELLDLLAGHFLQKDFDLRELFRTIAQSQAYRLSSGTETPDPRRQEWFAQQNVKILTAEQLYDCITVASLLDESHFGEFTVGRLNDPQRAEFLQQFQTLMGDATEYQAGIPQALTLMNGRLIGSATGLASSGLLKSLDAPFFTDAQRVEVVYLATLSRRPTEAEAEVVRQYLSDREAGVSVLQPLGDVLWALLNSAEFAMNH